MNADLNVIKTDPLYFSGVPEGCDGLLVAKLARENGVLLYILRDDMRLSQVQNTLKFFAPECEILLFPAWDCVPYDRVSPLMTITAQRVETLVRLAWGRQKTDRPWIIITTIAAALQKLPPKESFLQSSFLIQKGKTIDLKALQNFLTGHGYNRAETVMETGEYAFRGGLFDLFPPGSEEPLRIDLFGDEIEKIRAFDPMTQRSTREISKFTLIPAAEISLNDETVTHFRTNYRELFGIAHETDPLYLAISEGQKYAGMEHWCPLFFNGLDTLFSYCGDISLLLDYQVEEAKTSRLQQIQDYYEARSHSKGLSDGGAPYYPVPPEYFYMTQEEWLRQLKVTHYGTLMPFVSDPDDPTMIDFGGRYGHDFAESRAKPGENLFKAVISFVEVEKNKGHKIVFSGMSEGSAERILQMIQNHGLQKDIHYSATFAELKTRPKSSLSWTALDLEKGFIYQDIIFITEQDILGERLVRPRKRKRRSDQFLIEASSLSAGDLVVHVDHGIGRYDGLETLTVLGATHDCLRVLYDGNDKLFVPVENIDSLSRYGSENADVPLDKLGGVAWQARKAKLKKRIQDMAEQLISIAAQRQVKKAEILVPAEGSYDEFCSRFPFAETEDQLQAIEDTIADLGSGKPMDRLICGDVGFGKTEVALRTAFVAAMEGKQVALIVPTTLLSRQHYLNFCQRFAGFPLKIAQLSRLVPSKQAQKVKEGLAEGQIDLVIGTQALLAKNISFKNLGLVIIDEEQHFGVAHKERLKSLRADVHVLTLTATPIPRTLQLALTGVREMSVIATPPIDRLSVRTFVLPFDGMIIREAILREKFRGGQIFYVCPRLADMDRLRQRLLDLVPEIRVTEAHGRLTPTELEEVMTSFSEGHYDLLLATNIIESGLDMTRVNTIIIHRADMFGLSQLYQLRGRVGRSKTRGYAYLTLPPRQVITENAQKRLHVMQTLDGLGAGFTLASHDLDIRGAGNLLGDEQSGHIKEVGIELYQSLIEEAIQNARSGEGANLSKDQSHESWSPQLSLGISVLIPENYVRDLSVRLGLYRRLGHLQDREEVEAFAVELRDRFGKIPEEVNNLLEVILLKQLCRKAGIEKIDAGPKGIILAFYNNHFVNPAGLIGFISRQPPGLFKMRPDHRLIYNQSWILSSDKLKGIEKLLSQLVKISTE
jgi:transcription-repair coupling factor (superfamily II helicase)